MRSCGTTDTRWGWGRWKVEEEGFEENDTAFQEDIVSPVELARARSRGRTAMYIMARYFNIGPFNFKQKAGKRRSSVLDDLGSGGPMRRIQKKADPYSQGSSLSKHKREFDSSAIVENGETRMHNSGYGFVPIESTQMVSKILEHLERTSPKEKPSSSRLAGTTKKSATKMTSNLVHKSLDKVESSKFLLSSQNNHKLEVQHCIEENGPQRFAAPLNVLSYMNGNSIAPVQGSTPTTNGASTLALPVEPPQKKPAFQIGAPEDYEVLDDDNHSTAPVHGNAPTTNATSTLAMPDFEVLDDDNHSTAPVQGNAPTTNVASTLAMPAEPHQKKPAFQMSAPDDFELLDDDNHSTEPVQGNAPTTNAASTLALPRIYLEYDDPPQKKLRLSFSYNQ
ncbi:hypothetical protein Tco_0667535 [Tanacetum coccineum]